MPQLKPHNHCRLLSRASLRKHNAVKQYRRHRVAYTKTLFQEPLEIRTRQMQVMNSTYKADDRLNSIQKQYGSQKMDIRGPKRHIIKLIALTKSQPHIPLTSLIHRKGKYHLKCMSSLLFSLFFSLILQLNSAHVTSDH